MSRQISHRRANWHAGDQTLGEVNDDVVTPRRLTEAIQTDRPSRATSIHQGYYRWLRLSRLAMAAFFALALMFLIWAMPWANTGLDADDYTPELAFTVYLLGSTAIFGLLSLTFKELARRSKESLMAWSAVYDIGTGLHNRTYMYDRISLECARAERGGDVFSVITLQILIASSHLETAVSLSKEALLDIADTVDSLTHPADLVARLSGSELGIVAIGVDKDNRRAIVERLRSAIAADLPRVLGGPSASEVKAGVATFGIDGKDSAALVKAARVSAILARPRRARAA